MGVGAIAEAAIVGLLYDFGKEHVEADRQIADVQGAHAWGVDHPAAALNGMERPRGRCMASLGIGFADAAGGLGLIGGFVGEGVQERRFANAR